jgi:DNA-binding transcriptional regulator YdaS (Cro superfamily)
MFSPDEFNAAVKRAGGLTKLAGLIGESPQAVHNWKKRGIPANRCRAFAVLTQTRLKDLRDDWADYWPELGEAHE